MAITTDDFEKVWASTSPLTPYAFSDAQYKEGWNFIGSTPPSRQMWDFLQKNNDEKLQYLLAELAKKLNSTEAESTYATKQEAGVPYQIKRNTPYKVGDVLTSPSLPPGCVIVVTQAGTTGSTEPDWTTIKSNMGGGNS